MDALNHILHWRLTHGSHPFPGKDGGTCINEAAIVAAGFKYQPVRRVEDMPECFSRPICRLAMGLNDAANDVERQQLIRFVTRLACADTPEVERERAAYIHSRTARHYTFLEGLQILEGALAIGRQAEDAAPDEVRTRMEDSPAVCHDGIDCGQPQLCKGQEVVRAQNTHGVSRVTRRALLSRPNRLGASKRSACAEPIAVRTRRTVTISAFDVRRASVLAYFRLRADLLTVDRLREAAALFGCSIKNSSRLRPCFISAVSHFGVAPLPAQVSPSGPRYFGATFIPFRGWDLPARPRADPETPRRCNWACSSRLF